jgi:DNA repair and recombination protein RadB
VLKVTKAINTGSSCLDSFLGGGILSDTITLIYGEPETGKTTLAIQCAANCAEKNLKTLFIDCDNTFHAERLRQITQENFDDIAELIILIKPKNFNEQTIIVDQLQDLISKNFGLVVIDTFNSLYRAKVSETSTKASFELNRELNRQLALLAQTAKINHIPIVVTSQVKSVFNETSVSIAPVATRVMHFWAEAVIVLKPTEVPQIIKAELEKNRNTQEATCYLRIAETGIHDHE